MEFDRYLLRELLWELQKFDVQVPGLTDVPPEQIVVLGYSGYALLRIQVGTSIMEARLDWSAEAAPVLRSVEPDRR